MRISSRGDLARFNNGRPEGRHYVRPILPVPPILPVLPYFSPSVVFLSSAAFGGFGGLGRFIDSVTPFQNGSTLRSTSWWPWTRYSRIALSHCRPALATSSSQAPRAV